jgi:hypothetical protein
MSSLQTQLDAEVILENMPFNITNGLRMIKVFIDLCGKKIMCVDWEGHFLLLPYWEVVGLWLNLVNKTSRRQY